MSFVSTKEDVIASKEIALATVDRFAAAASLGIAMDAMELVLTSYLRGCITDGILTSEVAELVLVDFHVSCLSEISTSTKRGVR